jgi:hypothetical protein
VDVAHVKYSMKTKTSHVNIGVGSYISLFLSVGHGGNACIYEVGMSCVFGNFRKLSDSSYVFFVTTLRLWLSWAGVFGEHVCLRRKACASLSAVSCWKAGG